MPVRIQTIHVDSAGPLARLDVNPGLVTLFYGGNESGKTYLVELLIRSLFSARPFETELRKTELVGRVDISGLKPDGSITQLKPISKKKLEALLPGGSEGVPPSIARLLVVRAGEPALESGRSSGVNRAFLLQYLSNQGFLDRILESITATTRKAALDLESGALMGENKGDFKLRASKEAELKRLDEIRARVNQLYSAGERAAWRSEIQRIEAELAGQELAKRRLAWQQDQELRRDQATLSALPEDQISDLSGKVTLFDSREQECQGKIEQRKKCLQNAKGYPWLEQALPVYEQCINQGAGRPSNLLFYLALVCFVLAALAGYLGSAVGAILLALAGIGLGIVFLGQIRTGWQKAGAGKEIEAIQASFRERFGRDLTDLPMLRQYKDNLGKLFNTASFLEGEIDTLNTELAGLERQIHASFHALGQPDGLERTAWADTLQKLNAGRRRLEEQVHATERSLDRLGVDPSDYLAEDPGLAFSQEQVTRLTAERDDLQSHLGDEEDALKRLRQDLSNATGLEINADWEYLIHGLEERRADEAREYRELCARMIAENVVAAAIEDLRTQEETRISEALSDPQLSRTLQEITRHYQRMDLSGDALVVSDGETEYPLAELSTGAIEQVLLALRVRLAERAFGGQPAFLILDDAFQYSDWDRRGRLVDEVLRLAQRGWQVIYLSMDNHIRDLFQAKVAPVLSADFVYRELGEG